MVSNKKYERLEKNIFDILIEQQLKLGYRKETVRLYYMKKSLIYLLNVDAQSSSGDEALMELLNAFCEYEKQHMGDIEVSYSGDRYCFSFAEEVAEYVHEHSEGSEFLKELISLVSRHGINLEQVIAVFEKYSDHVVVEKSTISDFDLLVYFADGKPDDMKYCLSKEGEHVIYHRYTLEDYKEIFGE